jgi:hypothetical protein
MRTITGLWISSFIALAACSAAPPADDTTDEQQDAKSASPKSGSPAAAPSGSGSTNGTDSSPPAAGTCGGEKDAMGCWICCEDSVPAIAAQSKKIDQDWQKCACGASACATECKNDFCKNPDADADPSDACIKCLDGTKVKACDDAEDAAFQKLEEDPSYAAVESCGKDSKCDDKPDE